MVMTVLFLAFTNHSYARNVQTSGNEKNGTAFFKLSNENISLSVAFNDGILIADTLTGNPSWLSWSSCGDLLTKGHPGVADRHMQGCKSHQPKNLPQYNLRYMAEPVVSEIC